VQLTAMQVMLVAFITFQPQLLNAIGRKMPKTLSTLEELCQQNAKLGLQAIDEIYHVMPPAYYCIYSMLTVETVIATF
jgi:hypothetical protein